jgi:hypothetical protein
MSPKRRRPAGETIGGMLVGFDYQVFRATRPTPELIESAKPIPPVPAAGGGTLEVKVPEMTASADTAGQARPGDGRPGDGGDPGDRAG